jgi:hypothetical protein
LGQFSRIFAVPPPIMAGFAVAATVSSLTYLVQIGIIFFHTFLYSSFCDEPPQLSHHKR